MTQPDLSHFIPRSLDAKGKFLFWDTDVMMVALTGMLIGVATDYRLIGMAVGMAAAYAYNKTKGGKHPGVTAHLIYWYVGTPNPSAMPPSHLREFNG